MSIHYVSLDCIPESPETAFVHPVEPSSRRSHAWQKLAVVAFVAALAVFSAGTLSSGETSLFASPAVGVTPRPSLLLGAENSGKSDKTIDALEVLEKAEQKSQEAEKAPKSGDFYIDEVEEEKGPELSDSMKRKLRSEYLALGGSTNRRMGTNYFLWISIVITVLAVLTWLSGGCETGY